MHIISTTQHQGETLALRDKDLASLLADVLLGGATFDENSFESVASSPTTVHATGHPEDRADDDDGTPLPPLYSFAVDGGLDFKMKKTRYDRAKELAFDTTGVAME